MITKEQRSEYNRHTIVNYTRNRGEEMQALMKWLDGKKAIIGTLALGILGILGATEVLSVSSAWYQIAALVIATFTGVAFRTAIAKSGPSA